MKEMIRPLFNRNKSPYAGMPERPEATPEDIADAHKRAKLANERAIRIAPQVISMAIEGKTAEPVADLRTALLVFGPFNGSPRELNPVDLNAALNAEVHAYDPSITVRVQDNVHDGVEIHGTVPHVVITEQDGQKIHNPRMDF